MKIRTDLIEALGQTLGFKPDLRNTREWCTGRYYGEETYFKAYHRGIEALKYGLRDGWIVERPVVETALNYPHAKFKIFIFVGAYTVIKYFVLDFNLFLNNWNKVYEIEKLRQTTQFSNNEDVDKDIVKVTMKYCENQGEFKLTPMNIIQIDTSVSVNIDEIKNKPIRLF